MKLLWIDDDYTSAFNPMSRRLERFGFALKKLGSVEDAKAFVDADAEFEDFSSALLDVMLPSKNRCVTYGGLEIARIIANSPTTKRIAFLSVVPKNEIRPLFDQLVSDFRAVNFAYTDKTQLMEPAVFKDLVEFLNPPKS